MKKYFFCTCAFACLILSLLFGTVDFFGEKKKLYSYERFDSTATFSNTVRLSMCTGQSVCVKNEEIETVLARYEATVIKREEVDGLSSFYCYSPCFESGVVLFGETVNLHIVQKEDSLYLGTPLIFGSF